MLKNHKAVCDPQKVLLQRAEKAGQLIKRHVHGQWEVSCSGKFDEWPAYAYVANAMMPSDWQHRRANEVPIFVSGDAMPFRFEGERDGAKWEAIFGHMNYVPIEGRGRKNRATFYVNRIA